MAIVVYASCTQMLRLHNKRTRINAGSGNNHLLNQLLAATDVMIFQRNSPTEGAGHIQHYRACISPIRIRCNFLACTVLASIWAGNIFRKMLILTQNYNTLKICNNISLLRARKPSLLPYRKVQVFSLKHSICVRQSPLVHDTPYSN